MKKVDDLIEEIKLLSKPGIGFKPHKYIALISVLQLIREQKIRENNIYFGSLFKERFKSLFKIFGEEPDSNRPHTPFFHLSTTSFWKLIPLKDKEEILTRTKAIGSAGELNSIVLKAKINQDVFDLFKDIETNKIIEKKLIEFLENGMIIRRKKCSQEIIEKRTYMDKNNETETNEKNDVFLKNKKDVKNGKQSAFNKLNLNPFVNYLNLLHNRDANSQNLAESLATNRFTGKIQVSHPLVNTIEQMFQNGSKRHIILTGHAGDGKTTIAVEIFKKIKHISLEEPLQEDLSRREDLMFNNKEITIIKDLSEWSTTERINLIAEMISDSNKQFLLISNSGTLLDSFCIYEEKYGNNNKVGIENDILSNLASCTPKEWTYRNNVFTVINLSMICNLELAEKIFRRMIDHKHWEICEVSDCKKSCPIHRNLKLIWENERIIIERIFLAYRKMYEYGNRFTLRQLTAHLAYLITSGLNYQDIQKIMQNASGPLMTEYMFFNRFFGDSGKEIDQPAQQLRMIREIRKEEFGIHVCPVWERKIWMKRKNKGFNVNLAGLDNDFERLHDEAMKTDINSSYKAREQIRRIMFFLYDFPAEDQGKYIKTYLNSPMILKLISWQKQNDDELSYEDNNLKKSILHVLQEYFAGIRVPEGISTGIYLYITLNRGSEGIRQSTQAVLACFHKEDFKLRLDKEEDGLGGFRKNLVFEKGQYQIRFDLPMLDYIMMRNVGEIGQRLKSAYVDRLENFKGKLLLLKGDGSGDIVNIIRLQADYKFHRQEFKIREKRLEVSND